MRRGTATSHKMTSRPVRKINSMPSMQRQKLQLLLLLESSLFEQLDAEGDGDVTQDDFEAGAFKLSMQRQR